MWFFSCSRIGIRTSMCVFELPPTKAQEASWPLMVHIFSLKYDLSRYSKPVFFHYSFMTPSTYCCKHVSFRMRFRLALLGQLGGSSPPENLGTRSHSSYSFRLYIYRLPTLTYTDQPSIKSCSAKSLFFPFSPPW